MTAKPELSQSYWDLCFRMDKLDPKAAMYMLEEAPKLTSFTGYLPITVANITASFIFSETPQGPSYWWTLQDLLDTEEDTKCA